MAEVEFHKYLPPYRSLLTPNAQYDYRTHRLVPLSQLDLNTIMSRYHDDAIKKSSIKMKYKLLLSDVSRRALLLSMKVLSLAQPATLKATQSLWMRCSSFTRLPVEIQSYIFAYVDDADSYRSCLYVSKLFYLLAKPFLYRSITFTSTFRFAQFVTCLRLNSALGAYVLEVDLSQLKPGNWEFEEMHDDDENTDPEENDAFLSSAMILAGWRDWKFKNNPLYSLHPAPAIPLTKLISNGSVNSLNTQKKTKLSKYFKKRRHSHSHHPQQHIQALLSHNSTAHLPAAVSHHPRINRFLMNYLASKDVPVGSIIHLVNLCPNLTSLNVANLSLSTDYQIIQTAAHKYQSYDIMHNLHKDLTKVIDGISPTEAPFNPFTRSESTIMSSSIDIGSSASSVFSINTFSKPIRKYNSLLPPLPAAVRDILYLAKGDGKVFLSDLNLKSINNAHLVPINESEIFECMVKRVDKLRYINMTSMIWINVKMVREFLVQMLMADLVCRQIEDKEYLLYRGRHFDMAELVAEEGDESWERAPTSSPSLVIDLRDSGMYKNLQWAQEIDSNTKHGQKLIHKIINHELVGSFEEYVIRERIRRGRIGENYFA